MIKPIFEILENAKVLNQLCEIYYQNTGMVVSIHQPGAAPLPSFYPVEERSEFCKLIQSTPEGLARCLQCDHEGLEVARRKGSYHIYHCHAGLVDVAIPIDYKGVEVGSIYTGQVVLEEPSIRSLGELFGRLGSLVQVSFSVFANAYAQVRVVEKGRLLFYCKLLDLMANYIVIAENEIHLQKAMVLKDRELHRREIEKIKLEKTLKDLSISVLSAGQNVRGSSRRQETAPDAGVHVIEKACAFIRENYGRDIVLADVARAVFLSPNYFSSLFRRIVGSPFRAYLVRERITSARRLLVETDTPIKEIANLTGFKDYNYFNRTFRAIQGIPPARYKMLSRRRKAAGLSRQESTPRPASRR
jgi:AraC-like DNA-binding protein/ligand-binding sensor protein